MKSKKKIAIVMDSMNVGGTEKALIGFLNMLDYSKYIIVLLLQCPNGSLEKLINFQVRIKYWNEERIPVRDLLNNQIAKMQLLKVVKNIYNLLQSKKYENCWEKSIWYSVRYSPLIDEECYDAVIAYSNFNPEVVAKTLYCVQAKKKVLWVHGDVICCQEAQKLIMREYSKFEQIYCVSETIQKKFYSRYKCEKKTKVLHNFMDIQEIHEKSKEEIEGDIEKNFLLTVGRLDAVKGQDIIPKVVKGLLNNGYFVVWYLIGEGKLRDKIEDEIKKYSVEKNVILLGEKSNPYPYMKKCEIYVQTSLSEGWGLTIQEAKILKKPIIITPEPALMEQISNGENGLVTEDYTAEAMCKTICELLNHAELKNKFVSNLEKENYDNVHEINEFYNFIDN